MHCLQKKSPNLVLSAVQTQKALSSPWPGPGLDVYCENYSNNYKKHISNNHVFPLP